MAETTVFTCDICKQSKSKNDDVSKRDDRIENCS